MNDAIFYSFKHKFILFIDETIFKEMFILKVLL